MAIFSSRDNPRIKNARRTRDGLEKKFIFVEGLRLAEEFARSNIKLIEVFHTSDFIKNARGKNLLDSFAPEKVFEIKDSIFNYLSDTQSSQGIILIGETPVSGKDFFNPLEVQESAFSHLVLLHKINNPSNLGAILRTCEAVGCEGVIISKNSADVFAPKALRAAMGATFRLRFWTNVDFNQAIFWAKENDFITSCADINADKNFWNLDWSKKRLLIFGSEAHGLSDNEIKQVEESFKIPMENGVESLNLGVSCGIVLYEAKRNIAQK